MQTIRQTILLLIGTLLLSVPYAHAQQRYTALYDYSERNDGSGQVTTDLIRLSSEEGYFSSVSEHNYRKLIVQDSLAQTGLDPYTVVAMTREMAKGSRTTIITDARVTKRIVYEFPMTRLHYEESIPDVPWELLEGETEVNGIASRRARATLYGREWVVSYAPEIPFAIGPWKLTGLPGLVTEACTTDSLYHFTLVSFGPTRSEDQPVSRVQSKSKKRSKKEVLDALYRCEVDNRAWLKKLYPVSSQTEATPEELRQNALRRKNYQYIEQPHP
jgi:GLPGLI family protein